MTHASGDPYAHLRANAAAQKQTTVDRLSQAIIRLEADGRPVNTFTIKKEEPPRLQEQAGVTLEGERNPLGDALFAPLLEKVFLIRLSREALEKPLLTGILLHIPGGHQ